MQYSNLLTTTIMKTEHAIADEVIPKARHGVPEESCPVDQRGIPRSGGGGEPKFHYAIFIPILNLFDSRLHVFRKSPDKTIQYIVNNLRQHDDGHHER